MKHIDLIRVVPVNGARVRNPQDGYKHIPPEGAIARPDPYWIARKNEGAIEIRPATPPPQQ